MAYDHLPVDTLTFRIPRFAPLILLLVAAALAGIAKAQTGAAVPLADSSAAPGAVAHESPTAALTVEERLARLESEVDRLRQENQQLRNQIGITAATTSAASDASAAPSAAAVVEDQAALKAAENAARSAAVAVAKPAPPPERGISVSAITPPKVAKPAAEAAPVSIAAPPPSIIKPAGSEQMLSVGGFVQAQAEFGDPIDSRFAGLTIPADDPPQEASAAASRDARNDRFYLRRARIILAGRFNQDFDFKLAAEYTGALATTSSMRGQLADAYISWTRYPALNVTFGQFKTSYGHEFLSNDLTIYPIEHALVTDVLTLGRQIGGQASGTFFKTRLNYIIGVFNGNGVNTNENDNDSFLYAGRINFSPVKEHIPVLGWDTIWTAGANAYTSEDASITLPNGTIWTFPGRRTGWGVDTQVLVGPWDIWYEYLTTDFSPDNPVLAEKTTAKGWYLQGAYSIVPKKWQLVLRYDFFDPNVDSAGDETKTWTFGINLLLKGDDLKLMLNYMTSNPRILREHDDASWAQRLLFRVQAAF